VRQLLTESVVLALAGGALGLLLGTLGIRALLAVNTAGLPRVGDAGASVALDWRVVLFTIVVSVATGLLFGLGPALRTSHSDLTTTLKEGAGRSGTGTGQDRTRSALVVAEVALALALLIGSALLIRTSIALGHVDPGFDASNVLTLRTSLAGPAFETSAGVERVILDAVDRLEALPGVEVATATCCVPLQGGYGLPYRIVGRPTEDGPFHGSGQWMTTSPGYFDVFRIPVRRGRVLDRRDDAAAPAVVVINEAMVRAHWPDSDPLGDRLVIGRGVMREFDGEPDRLIIGVVGDTRDGGLNSDPQPAMYIPQAQVPDPVTALNAGIGPMAWVVRTRRDPSSMSRPVQEALRRATDLPVSDVRTMSDIVSLSTSRQRFNMWSMSVFGASALLLAALGIYGLMAFSVAQRRRELGIRVALGAEPAAVGRMVVVQGMRLAGLGIALGLVGAFGLSRLVESFLFGVAPSDPAVFAAVPLLLGIVALLAVALPARRAGRTDPMVALRYE